MQMFKTALQIKLVSKLTTSKNSPDANPAELILLMYLNFSGGLHQVFCGGQHY
jgi:hypothetical protein